MRNIGSGPGILPTVKRDERAGCSLKGGLVSLLEGLEYSEAPCATVLSVPGLLVLLGPFPFRRRFILRV